jgi:hypothetical protein
MKQEFASLGEFLANCPDPKTYGGRRAESFNGHQTYKEAFANVYKGRDDAVTRSEKLLDEMEADGIETNTLTWEYSQAGAIPCVPSFLAGAPESMRCLIDTATDRAPVKIFASVCLSAGFSSREIEQRGTAILALCRKLQSIRPVELWLYADMDGRENGDGTGRCALPIIRIDTSPLDLTTASYIMTDAGFLRQLCFSWAGKHGFTGAWAWGMSPMNPEAQAKCKKALGAGENDLFIPGGYLTDPIVRESVKWVNDQVRKYHNQEERV